MRTANEFQGRQPCRAELKNPKYAPPVQVLADMIVSRPEADIGSSSESAFSSFIPYQAGVRVRATTPPISPALSAPARQPKSCLTVGPSSASTRLFTPS